MSAIMRFIIAMAVILLMTVGQTKSLTTFGNTNKNSENEKPPNQAPIVRGRECKTENDCNGITNTYCMTDVYRDHKTRCLCVTKQPPSNGQCPKTPKALKSVCSNDRECLEGALCSPPINATANSATKTCMCKEGFVEDDHMCSSGFVSSIPALFTMLTACSLLRLVIVA